MVKEFRYYGYTLEELKKMSIEDFAKISNSRVRRSILRGLDSEKRKLLENIKKYPDKFHKTHLRDMIILPQMVGAKIGVYRGGGSEKWVSLTITPEMIGRRLGEFVHTTKYVKHSAPGIGASKGTLHVASKK
ncbi:MAG: 30S ribosomal protein S19 [Candidatus Aenigmarchaeota archaeon]|nr:30S ribosomal protein S19 [Candidatus Aenigmarchaeota archaeon]MDW8149752.1 30S ribosomal protein S19 [Candidatus Aenigmarchaeota archaeon]